ncbi:GNAT family N-acetyltransferase [Lagierella sp.]|uniref:GNAT family N-acetyltransferase n=1 Tax=Lagierella sp. TaxID=2849657 RepID=UPI00260FEF7B|nr:GNAT family N-acetyltransferase [Lagierella sp.]
MEVREIKTFKDFENSFKDIERLWENCNEKRIFYSPIFLRQYLKSYRDENLHYLLMYHNNRPSLLAPLEVIERKKGFIRWRELRFAIEGDFKNFILDNTLDNEDTLLKNIFKYMDKLEIDRISLDNILPRTNLCSYLLKNQRYNPHIHHQNMVPILDFSSFESFESFEKTFPANTRKYKNKLLREKNVEFEIIDDMNEKVYEEIKNLHILEKDFLKKSGRKERYSLYEEENREDFIKNIQLKSKSVRLFILRDKDNGNIIAYRNCYIDKNELVSWNTAYNPDFRDYSLSNAIFYFIFKSFFNQDNFTKFNFGVGGYPWKFGYANDFTNVYRLDYFKTEKGQRVKKMIGFKSALEG